MQNYMKLTRGFTIGDTGAGSAGKQEKRTQAIFNHTEDYVLYPGNSFLSSQN